MNLYFLITNSLFMKKAINVFTLVADIHSNLTQIRLRDFVFYFEQDTSYLCIISELSWEVNKNNFYMKEIDSKFSI